MMKRKNLLVVASIMLCVVLLFSFSACSDTTGNDDATSSPKTNSTATVKPTEKATVKPTEKPTEKPVVTTPKVEGTPVPIGQKAPLKDMDGYAFSEESPTKFVLEKAAGNNHVLSGTKVEAFSMEADITWLDGNKATFVFGAIDNVVDDFETLYGVELGKDDAGNLFIKMFQDSSPGYTGLGDGIIPIDTPAGTDVDTSKPVHFELEVTKDKEVKVSVNNKAIDFELDASKGFEDDYKGGYLGVLTWETSAEFDNLYYTDNGKLG